MIGVVVQSSQTDGGCNGCTRFTRTSPPGVEVHEVVVIGARSLSMRLCKRCWKDMIAEAKSRGWK